MKTGSWRLRETNTQKKILSKEAFNVFNLMKFHIIVMILNVYCVSNPLTQLRTFKSLQHNNILCLFAEVVCIIYVIDDFITGYMYSLILLLVHLFKFSYQTSLKAK